MRYTVRFGEEQGTSDTGSKADCLGWAKMRSERHPELLIYVVEVAPPPKLFGRPRAVFRGGQRLW